MHSQRAYRAVQPVPGRLVADVQHLLLDRAGCLVQLAVLGVGRVDELLQVLRLLLPLPLPGLDLPQLGQQVLLLLNLTGVTGQVKSGQEVRRCCYSSILQATGHGSGQILLNLTCHRSGQEFFLYLTRITGQVNSGQVRSSSSIRQITGQVRDARICQVTIQVR